MREESSNIYVYTLEVSSPSKVLAPTNLPVKHKMQKS